MKTVASRNVSLRCIRCRRKLPKDSSSFDDIPVKVSPEIYNVGQRAGVMCPACLDYLSAKIEKYLEDSELTTYADDKRRPRCNICARVVKEAYKFKNVAFGSYYLGIQKIILCKKHGIEFEAAMTKRIQKFLPKLYSHVPSWVMTDRYPKPRAMCF